MSLEREDSESSAITYRSTPEQDTQNGHETQDQDPNVGTDTPHPSPQRVRFQSASDIRYNAPPSEDAENKHSERETAQQQGQPHRPSEPYLHEGADIADAPLRERTQVQEEDQTHEQQAQEAQEAVEATEKVVKTSKAKFQAAGYTFVGKARSLAARLGRPEAAGDDFHPGVYHPEWASGGQVPLGDMTDNKHKTDEEKRKHQATSGSEAHRLVREVTQDQTSHRRRARGKPYPRQGTDVRDGGDLGIDSGLRYRAGGGGILSQLMKLNNSQQQHSGASSSQPSTLGTPSGNGRQGEKPRWYNKTPDSSPTIPSLNGGAGLSGASTPVSSDILTAASKRRSKQSKNNTRLEDEIRVTVHIAEIIARQRYIMQLCKALMRFGAPTHRLEEYMQMTAKVLEVDSQFLYLPGCMIMSFDDASTRTTEFKLVRTAQGVDLGRLASTHSVYKNVVHDVIGVEEAIQELEDIMKQKPRFNKIIIVLTYGLATAMVGPFAFDARPIDLPIIFINGCFLGLLQHVLAPHSVLYSNVFEVTASVLTSFLARAFGSIPHGVIDGKRNYLFCFSAMAQSSIALILPGFLVLCSSLELQSHQMIAGSIRMVYAIIYALFLGYGITVGTTIYGLIDPNASSEITCPRTGSFKNPYVARFPFVVAYASCLAVVNQGKWKQAPAMVFIALAGYVANYFSTKRLGSNSQVANTVGAFTIGVMGNLYSRIWHGHAATAILPAIFVLVPSGLAASGSLISGVESANEIRTNVTQHGGGTQPGAGLAQRSSVFNLGFGMIQVAIGITVGLFLAALVVYPYGKRRSGLFSF
ncbi:hypothetical protein AWENTII_002396 [Aspergillus wentii]